MREKKRNTSVIVTGFGVASGHCRFGRCYEGGDEEATEKGCFPSASDKLGPL